MLKSPLVKNPKPPKRQAAGNSLVLYNDDYHTFNYVIDALIEVCKMERVQAIQCTYLVPLQGEV